MIDKEKLKSALEFAKENKIKSIEVDGIRIEVPQDLTVEFSSDRKFEELLKPLSPFDEMTEEEILYYATPYYDELQAKKKAKQEKIKEEQQVRNQ